MPETVGPRRRRESASDRYLVTQSIVRQWRTGLFFFVRLGRSRRSPSAPLLFEKLLGKKVIGGYGAPGQAPNLDDGLRPRPNGAPHQVMQIAAGNAEQPGNIGWPQTAVADPFLQRHQSRLKAWHAPRFTILVL